MTKIAITFVSELKKILLELNEHFHKETISQ
jgi:hypothetical protein